MQNTEKMVLLADSFLVHEYGSCHHLFRLSFFHFTTFASISIKYYIWYALTFLFIVII